MKLIELHNIYAAYDEEYILENVNMNICENDFIGIIGPNGGGKTSLLKVILGLLKIKQGEIKYNCDKQNLFGYMPQISNIDKHFPINVVEIVMSGLMSQKGMFGHYTKKDKQKAIELLERYGMADYKNRQIGELSGGQMQKIFLFRAIISSPKILILDEPTNYVDNTFEQELYTILKELNKTMSILMVSHDIGTICSYVKTIACVNKNLHYHNSNLITQEQLKSYNCPIEIIAHGHIPHRVLADHDITTE